MPTRPPLLVRLALAAVRLASLVVPRRDRDAWRREWDGELLGAHADARRQHRESWRHEMSLFRRSTGALLDAAWLRRQFTRDSELVHDLRHGARVLRRQPGFALLATLVLALGIGSTTAVMSVADALLRVSLPFPAADELAAVWLRDTDDPTLVRGEVSPGTFVDLQTRIGSFAGIAGLEPYSVDYTGGERPEVVLATRVTEGFFDLLGVTPLHGRLLRPDDHLAGAAPVVVLDHDLWASRFGSDPAIVGESIPLDGAPVIVAGVLPPGLELRLLGADRRGAWLPKSISEGELRSRGLGWWAMIGRRLPGVSVEDANADLARVSADLAAEHPSSNATVVAFNEPLGEHLIAGARPAMTMLAGAVALVLLIACANVANMLLARAADRDREFAVRSSLGAGRGRLVRQLLAETGLIAILGTAAGLGLALWIVDLVVALAPPELPRLAEAQLDMRLLVSAVAAGLAATLFAGLLPALQFSRARRPEALGAGRVSTGTRSSRAIGDTLAVAEIALAVVLVISAGLLLRSFGRLMTVDPGFNPESVLTLQVFAWDRENQSAPHRALFIQAVVEDLRQLPGAVDAGAVSAMPFTDANIDVQGSIAVDGRPPLPDGEQDLTSITMATPGYFATMDIPVVEGRGLAATDTGTSEPVAVVGAALARRLWPDESPVGRFVTIGVFGQPQRVRIVGVVGELRHDGLDRPAREEIFVPHAQVPFGSMTFVVRAAGDASALNVAAQRAVWRHDPLLTIYSQATVRDLVSTSVAPRRFSLVLVGLFAVVALVLAAAGIYGVLSFTTERRLPEFGMRIALGATSRDLGRLVVGRAVRLCVAGLVAGLALAAVTGRVVQSALFEVSAADPITLAGVSLAVLTIAVVACALPARRAMRVDPLAALRD